MIHTAQQPKYDHPSIVAHRLNIPLEVVLPDEVNNHIHSFSVRGLLDFFRKVLRFVVDGVCGAVMDGLDELDLVL